MLAKLDNAEFCIKDDSLKFVTGARITLDLYILGSDSANITESMQEIINKETTTRWSFNCRFKSLFSPYGDKKLGEFFEVLNLKPASMIGLDYEFPEFKQDG